MFKKFNSKTLSVVFIALLALVILSLLFDKSNRSSGFKAELVDIDSAKISAILIDPPGDKENIELKRTGATWTVKINNKWYNANSTQLESILKEFMKLRANRVAARDEERWAEFHVNDSLGTRVQVFQGEKIVSDIYLGRFSYRQAPNSSPYMRQQPLMFTFVRLTDEKEVYSTEGMIGMSFNRAANDFRDRKIVDFDKSKLQSISVNAAEGNYTITNENGKWLIDGLLPDSTAMENYISGLSKLNSGDFIEESVINMNLSPYSITIQGLGFNPIEVKAFPADSVNGFAIESSLNKGSYFSGNKADVFNKIFPGKEKLFGNIEEE
jgi:hypothetical protein